MNAVQRQQLPKRCFLDPRDPDYLDPDELNFDEGCEPEPLDLSDDSAADYRMTNYENIINDRY